MHNKGNSKQGEKTAFRMGESNKQTTDKELISTNIQTVHATQYLKNKRPNEKVGQITKQTFLQGSHTEG